MKVSLLQGADGMEEAGTYKLGTNLSSPLELVEPSVELGRGGSEALFCLPITLQSLRKHSGRAGKGNVEQVETRCEHGSFESLFGDLWSIAFSALLSLPHELPHSMCTSSTINSLGKFGFSGHLMVCIVCSVSSCDSVLAGCALPWLCALRLALKGGKVYLPREPWSLLLGRNI